MKIVYATNTGHTYQYAQLLGKSLDVEVLPISKIKEIDPNTEVIFMGWVFAGAITGIKKVMKNCHVVSVAAVGMTPKSEENNRILIERNKIEIPFFYFQGGVDYTKLKGIKKFMLKMVAKMIINKNKPEDKEVIEIFKNGGNFVSEDNLKEIILHFKDERKSKENL